ncbi:uncharacterized protein LOC122387097 [Amphibalanus amphitrite]|uniref:uncharacterized protein LOC122387097 n=1 Tax=Amphibalanus amphitrite TaxID=1232801 RepID=UPI001C900798|nr:uncharacterized protein LOC122387097 [Amphibalanus amphitrite]
MEACGEEAGRRAKCDVSGGTVPPDDTAQSVADGSRAADGQRTDREATAAVQLHSLVPASDSDHVSVTESRLLPPQHSAVAEERTDAPPEQSPELPAGVTVKSERSPDGGGGAPDPESEDQLTHVELGTVFRDTLTGLLAEDPLLNDLPAVLTPAELRSLTALERGTAMGVLVNRGQRLTRVIVQRTATVRDLKMALRSAVELELARRGGRRRAISWRYVWRANWLSFGGRRLKDDNARLEKLGIGNRAEVRFVKRIRAKRGQRDKKGGQV